MFQDLFNDLFIFYPTDNTHFALAFGAYEWVHMMLVRLKIFYASDYDDENEITLIG